MPSMQRVMDRSENCNSNYTPDPDEVYPRGTAFRVVHPGSEYDGDVAMLIWGPRIAIIHSPNRDHIGTTFSGTYNELNIEPIELEVQDAHVL